MMQCGRWGNPIASSSGSGQSCGPARYGFGTYLEVEEQVSYHSFAREVTKAYLADFRDPHLSAIPLRPHTSEQ